MNVKQIIEVMGGRASLIQFTGLSKGRISQWISEENIPRPWLMLFHEKHPDRIPHPDSVMPELQEVDHA